MLELHAIAAGFTPSHIARDNNKFIFSYVKKGVRAKDLEDGSFLLSLL